MVRKKAVQYNRRRREIERERETGREQIDLARAQLIKHEKESAQRDTVRICKCTVSNNRLVKSPSLIHRLLVQYSSSTLSAQQDCSDTFKYKSFLLLIVNLSSVSSSLLHFFQTV